MNSTNPYEFKINEEYLYLPNFFEFNWTNVLLKEAAVLLMIFIIGSILIAGIKMMYAYAMVLFVCWVPKEFSKVGIVFRGFKTACGSYFSSKKNMVKEDQLQAEIEGLQAEVNPLNRKVKTNQAKLKQKQPKQATVGRQQATVGRQKATAYILQTRMEPLPRTESHLQTKMEPFPWRHRPLQVGVDSLNWRFRESPAQLGPPPELFGPWMVKVKPSHDKVEKVQMKINPLSVQVGKPVVQHNKLNLKDIVTRTVFPNWEWKKVIDIGTRELFEGMVCIRNDYNGYVASIPDFIYGCACLIFRVENTKENRKLIQKKIVNFHKLYRIGMVLFYRSGLKKGWKNIPNMKGNSVNFDNIFADSYLPNNGLSLPLIGLGYNVPYNRKRWNDTRRRNFVKETKAIYAVRKEIKFVSEGSVIEGWMHPFKEVSPQQSA